jgi:ATP-dependent Lon protease
MPDGNVTVILQGKKRFEIDTVVSEEPYLTAKIKEVPEKDKEKMILSFSYSGFIKELAIQIIKESPNIPSEATFAKKY